MSCSCRNKDNLTVNEEDAPNPITVDKAPDGTVLGKDGSQGGKIPFYSYPGGGKMSNPTGGAYVAADSEHATGANYSPKTASKVSSELGGLSSKYESNGDPGSIFHDINGTISYGTYQINTGTGSMNNFLKYEKENNINAYNQLISSGGGTLSGQQSQDFQSTWKTLSNDSTFAADQKAFIQSTHYDVAVANIKNSTGLDIGTKSLAVQDAIWSTSVQNGPNSSVFTNAFAGKNVSQMSDADIINSIYDERSRTSSSGGLVYFSKGSSSIQRSVANRLTSERQDALGMLGK